MQAGAGMVFPTPGHMAHLMGDQAADGIDQATGHAETGFALAAKMQDKIDYPT